MARVLICVSPAKGHVGPTLPVAEALVGAGHTVHVLTGRGYVDAFDAVGAHTARLPEEVDFDGSFPERAGLRGIALARADLTGFVTRMRPQLAAIDELLTTYPVDLVLCDPLLMAGLPLTMRRRRPPVLVLGFIPLAFPMPGLAAPRTLSDRARNLVMTTMMRTLMKPVQAMAVEEVRSMTGRAPETLFMDWPLGSEGVVQMTCPGFELQRELPMPVEFVGPLSSSSADRRLLPPCWSDVDGDRLVVLVAQGSVANEPDDLVLPTLDALAGQDILVIVSTGGVDLPENRVPDNARLAETLPYDDVLPRCALMVTNGGYGGVNHALRHGVPLVCVGATEDKPAVVERIRLSGVGVGLMRPRASPRVMGKVIERVLSDPRYRARARALAEEIDACPGTDGVVDMVQRVVERA